jgi:hypothetical protein
MLRPVALVDQWRAIVDGLPDGWGDARLRLTVEAADAERAAALLAPVNPGRRGGAIAFHAARRGSGASPDLVRRLLARLDAERIDGSLELVRIGESEAVAERPRRRGLAEQWDGAEEALPDDWSDLYLELELASTDHLERGALLLAPVNPARFGGRPAFRLRVARRFGYGASASMARRCFERLDAESIRGELRVLRALSDTKPVATQGPVWYVGGRAV